LKSYSEKSLYQYIGLVLSAEVLVFFIATAVGERETPSFVMEKFIAFGLCIEEKKRNVTK
jgi:hypothetical protein